MQKKLLFLMLCIGLFNGSVLAMTNDPAKDDESRSEKVIESKNDFSPLSSSKPLLPQDKTRALKGLLKGMQEAFIVTSPITIAMLCTQIKENPSRISLKNIKNLPMLSSIGKVASIAGTALSGFVFGRQMRKVGLLEAYYNAGSSVPGQIDRLSYIAGFTGICSLQVFLAYQMWFKKS